MMALRLAEPGRVLAVGDDPRLRTLGETQPTERDRAEVGPTLPQVVSGQEGLLHFRRGAGQRVGDERVRDASRRRVPTTGDQQGSDAHGGQQPDGPPRLPTAGHQSRI